MKTSTSVIEILEARIAPAAIYHYTDVDGDLVTVKTSKGTNADLAARVAPAEMPPTGLGNQLGNFTLTGIFDGTDISITATPQKIGGVVHGDGFVNVGAIQLTGFNLGNVSVHGDVGKIAAGAGAAKVPAIKSITVQSLGVLGTATGAPNLISNFNGSIGSLTVKGDVNGALVTTNASMGPVNIGGSLIASGASADSGEIFSQGNMGPVKIGGDVDGGGVQRSGLIESNAGSIASVTIGGSLFGSVTNDTGEIYSLLNLGPVKIGGHVFGDSGFFSGVIQSNQGKLASVSIGGNLVGSSGATSGYIYSLLDMGPVKIGGDVHGGTNTNTGLITTGTGKLASVTVGGSLIGGTMDRSGSILPTGALGWVKIGGDLRGGSGVDSGAIESRPGLGKLAIASATIGGSMIGGSGILSGVIDTTGNIGTVKIGHDLIGGTGGASGRIRPIGDLGGVSLGGEVKNATITAIGSIGFIKVAGDMADGRFDPLDGSIGSIFVGGGLFGSVLATDRFIGSLVVKGDFASNVLYARGKFPHPPTSDVALGSLIVGGSVSNSAIHLGYNSAGNPVEGNAQLGSVHVAGSWSDSSLTSGVQPTAGGFGDGDDAAIPGGSISRIASIVIGGQVAGTSNFEAGQIGSFHTGGVGIPLTTGAHNDISGGLKVAGLGHAVGATLDATFSDSFAAHIFEV